VIAAAIKRGNHQRLAITFAIDAWTFERPGIVF
jgi:hypothetical protein